MRNESIQPSRPTVIPCGKYGGVPIAQLSIDDLVAARREFSRSDPAVQGAIMSVLHRRRVAARNRLGRARAVARSRSPR